MSRQMKALMVCAVMAMASPAYAEELVEEPEESVMDLPFDDGFFALDIEALFSHQSDLGVLTFWSLGMGLHLEEWTQLTFGLSLSGGSAEIATGDRGAFTFAPWVEYWSFPRDWLQVYATAGAAFQVRSGAELSTGFGTAPFLGLGARLWTDGCAQDFDLGKDGADGICMSVGPQTRIYSPLSSVWITTVEAVPGPAALIWSTGLDIQIVF